MPKIIYEEITRSPREPKYPLEQWMADLEAKTKSWQRAKRGQPQPSLLLIKGRDYKCKTTSMLRTVYRWNDIQQHPLSTVTTEWGLRIFWG